MNYTWATNLKKTADMDDGQVSYKEMKLVVKFTIEKDKDAIRQTLKTKTERFPDFAKEYREYTDALQRAETAVKIEKIKQQQEEEKQAKDAKKKVK